MAKESQRPLLAIAAERDAEEHARRLLIAERITHVEQAMRKIGFDDRTIYWRVAVLVAKVAGWQPLRRSLEDIADDDQVAAGGSTPASRKRSVRRALNELERWGLLTWQTEAGETRRGTRPQSNAVILLSRQTILAEARGVQVVTKPEPAPIATPSPADPPADHQPAPEPEKRPTPPGRYIYASDADKTSDKRADKTSDKTGDKTGDKPRTKPVTKPVTTENASSYTLSTLKNPIPKNPSSPGNANEWAAAAASLKGFVWSDPERIANQAEASGMQPADLVDLVEQTKAAGKSGGAVVAAIRSGAWPGLVDQHRDARKSTEQAAPLRDNASAEQLRIRATKAVRAQIRRPVMMDDPAVIAAIVPALLRAGLGDAMTAAERHFFESRRRRDTAERSAAEAGKSVGVGSDGI